MTRLESKTSRRKKSEYKTIPVRNYLYYTCLDISQHVGEVGSAPESNHQILLAPGHQALHVGSLTPHQLEMIQVEQAQGSLLRQLQYRTTLQQS